MSAPPAQPFAPTESWSRPWGWWAALAALALSIAAVGWWLAQRPLAPAPGAGGGGPSAPVTSASPAQTAAAEVDWLRPQVLATFPHDPAAFTQGLVWDAGRLFESTGLEGQSTVREVDLATGTVLRRRDLPPDVFGEGLALYKDRLIQITWKDHVAFEWARDDFRKLGEHSYEGEGWGLCLDGARLVMSDGSGTLTFRDPVTFSVQGTLDVTLDGQGVRNLNELECVGDEVYANVWLTDYIYRIDKRDGQVTGVIDAAGLLTPEEEATADVLNGIAHKPETGTFLITGKLWPKLFEVHFASSTAALPFAMRRVRPPGGLP
jgi:glutaminyl-peptide cyclotransferase